MPWSKGLQQSDRLGGTQAAPLETSPEAQLASFLAKYTPEIAARAQAILQRMREILPGAVQLVYDNYNALAIGFGPSDRTSEALFSVAVFPRWVSLFFLKGAGLPDPHKILKGSGNVARHVVIAGAGDLDQPAIRELMGWALSAAGTAMDDPAKARLVIRSVSAKQRPRRPG